MACDHCNDSPFERVKYEETLRAAADNNMLYGVIKGAESLLVTLRSSLLTSSLLKVFLLQLFLGRCLSVAVCTLIRIDPATDRQRPRKKLY